MAEFQTNKETQASLERIISNAEKQLVLVSPYIKLTKTLFTRLKGCAERGVIIKILYRTGQLNDDNLNQLTKYKNIELRYMDDLHAKCYFNEREMIVTSLNLLESSEQNWEMGILIDGTVDKVMFDKAKFEVQTIFGGSKLKLDESLSTTSLLGAKSKHIAKLNVNGGFCIRCRHEIPFNMDKPLCKICFTSWDGWRDKEYPEEYCHFSGAKSDGTICFAKPILKENWKEAKRIHSV